jgi:hypothetical protein
MVKRDERAASMFKAMPGFHMEFIAKQSIDVGPSWNLCEDSTNVLWGILPPEYSTLSPQLFLWMDRNGFSHEFLKMRYVVLRKYIPETVRKTVEILQFTPVPNAASIAAKQAAEIGYYNTWRIYAMLPNMSYMSSFDKDRVKEPLHPKIIDNELISKMYKTVEQQQAEQQKIAEQAVEQALQTQTFQTSRPVHKAQADKESNERDSYGGTSGSHYRGSN